MLASGTAETQGGTNAASRGGSRRFASRGLALSPALVLLLFTGCGRLKQQIKTSMDNNPQIRQGAVDSARKSCIQRATAKAPKLPGIQEKIDNYCDCFATKGLGKFSNSELASIGFHGGQFTPEQKSKLNEAVQMCVSTLRGRPAKPGISVPGLSR